ncbi:MAG TPA: NAD(P)H-binding protein [Gemmatimonadaceae bacterium]|nr:NAD(P)H-binding protein [Gemmatimonadaceae bacterium]
MPAASVFVTGATGYIGSRLAALLAARGHSVRALVRRGSEHKVPRGVTPVIGDALDAASFADALRSGETFIQLVGTSHPSPSKAAEFRSVDLASARASIENAAHAGVAHFVYVSVAHPAPAMHAYIAARTEAEALLCATGLSVTVLRPWYVLGPGHRWPYALLPLYWVARRVPSLREGATRLGLVTIRQMLAALVAAVESPPSGVRVWEVPDIRRASALRR